LIVATMGRAFWILDDLAVLRQHDQAEQSLKVYQPEPSILGNWGSQLNGNAMSFKGTDTFTGVNPANGVIVYYNLPKLADSVHVTLEIRDASGALVNTFTSKPDANHTSYDGGPPAAAVLSKAKGLNRFVWDMRYPIMAGVPNVYIEGSYRGHKVSPGQYTLVMRYNNLEVKATCSILANPLYAVSTETYQQYHAFMSSMETTLTDMHKKINTIYAMRGQLENVLPLLSDGKQAALKKTCTNLIKKMKTWDEEMIQRKSKVYDDVDNFENKFTANYLFLINQTESDIPRVNQPNRDRLLELTKQWDGLRSQAIDILEKEAPAITKQLWEAGIGAVQVSVER
jgi:hypothetical protein